jgi:hypothetical protein
MGATMATRNECWKELPKSHEINIPDESRQSLLPDPIFDGRLLETAEEKLIVGFVGFSISVASEFDLIS